MLKVDDKEVANQQIPHTVSFLMPADETFDVFAGIGFGLHSVGLWPAVFLHAMMSVWCIMCLLRSPLKCDDGW